MNVDYNYERIPRRASCLQWTGENNDAVFALLAQHGMIGEMYREVFITIHFNGCNYHTLRHGDWILVGEDSAIRFYTDEKFKLMYRPICA